MTNAILIALLLLQPQSDFTSFSYCIENTRGPWELQCFELDLAGKGTFKFIPRDADLIEVGVELSADVAAAFVELLADTSYLADGADYESGRKVANLGTKKLTLNGPTGVRAAEFNFSTRREVTKLVSFFARLIVQELLMFDIDVALQFDRLAIPKKLEQIEKDLRARRVADAKRLIPVLDRIAGDRRLVNFARETANRLKRQIEGSD